MELADRMLGDRLDQLIAGYHRMPLASADLRLGHTVPRPDSIEAVHRLAPHHANEISLYVPFSVRHGSTPLRHKHYGFLTVRHKDTRCQYFRLYTSPGLLASQGNIGSVERMFAGVKRMGKPAAPRLPGSKAGDRWRSG